MKKLLIAFLMLTYALNPSFAQDLKIDFSSGTLILDGIANLIVEGYDGKEVLVYGRYHENNDPSLSKGLKMIHSKAPKQTMELDHRKSGDKLEISTSDQLGLYRMRVPKNLNIICKAPELDYEYNGNKIIKISNMAGEIELMSMSSINIDLIEISGSASIVTHGNIRASLAGVPPNGSLSFDTYRGYVDVTIPTNASMNVNLRAKKGAIYTNADIQNRKEGQENVIGKIGKGGADLIVNTESGGNIYIRQK